MRISERGLALIRQCEGFSATPYICPAGKQSIGYGHVILPWESYRLISREEGENLLLRDIAPTEQAIGLLVKNTLSQPQFDALVSFTYNIGAKAFEKSTLLSHLNKGETGLAAEELDKWVYGGGKRLPGLVARRKAEKALFLMA